jgi:hypothetical protein
MSARIRSRLSKTGPFLRLAYSAPSPAKQAADEARTYEFLAAKALPFVKLRPNDQPMWRPESFWHVRATGNWERDMQTGRKYARQAIAAMKLDRNSTLISLILQDIIKQSLEEAANTGRRRHGPIVLGFLAEVSQSAAIPDTRQTC